MSNETVEPTSRCYNCKLAERPNRPYSTEPLLCLNVDQCAGEVAYDGGDEVHHYGCYCDLCVQHYQNLK